MTGLFFLSVFFVPLKYFLSMHLHNSLSLSARHQQRKHYTFQCNIQYIYQVLWGGLIVRIQGSYEKHVKTRYTNNFCFIYLEHQITIDLTNNAFILLNKPFRHSSDETFLRQSQLQQKIRLGGSTLEGWWGQGIFTFSQKKCA